MNISNTADTSPDHGEINHLTDRDWANEGEYLESIALLYPPDAEPTAEPEAEWIYLGTTTEDEEGDR